MAPKNDRFAKNNVNKGSWTEEEDRKLSQYIKTHGEKRWQSVAVKAGLNRCGKSCRLRWLNYLRPNIKRGNISDQEEDLIIRLHKLLGNRWALIAGRLPGRTDNEIKNYWNSHLSKRLNSNKQQPTSQSAEPNKSRDLEKEIAEREIDHSNQAGISESLLHGDEFFNFSEPCPVLSSYNQQLSVGSDYLGQAETFDNHFDFCMDLDFPWVTQFLEYDENMGDWTDS